MSLEIDTGLAIIVGSIMSLVGMVIIIELNNKNWFKRENFKMQKSNVMAENKLKLKKLERELGVTGVAYKPPEKSITDTIKDIDIGKIKEFASMVQKPDDDYIEVDVDEKPPGIAEAIMSYAENNPDAVGKAIDLLGDKLGKKGDKPDHPRQV